MKKLFQILTLLLGLSVYAQQGEVNYGFVESFFSASAQGKDYNAKLTFDKEKAYYETAKHSLEKEISDAPKVSKGKNGVRAITFGKKLSELGDQVYIDTKKDTIWSNFLMGEQRYLQEKTPQIDWKITTETKKIGKFDCIKATATFRGRDYTAWFTLAVPVKFGPWKLHGLPGLILEAYDKDKYLYWYFKNITYPIEKEKDLSSLYKLDPDAIFLSYIDFKKKQQEILQANYEKALIVSKKFGATAIKTKLNQAFIECEEE
jgi:GLPGLI family protein